MRIGVSRSKDETLGNDRLDNLLVSQAEDESDDVGRKTREFIGRSKEQVVSSDAVRRRNVVLEATVRLNGTGTSIKETGAARSIGARSAEDKGTLRRRLRASSASSDAQSGSVNAPGGPATRL